MQSKSPTFDQEKRLLSTQTYALRFGSQGEIQQLSTIGAEGASHNLLEEAEATDLWRLRFSDGQVEFSGNMRSPTFSWDASSAALSIQYTSPVLHVKAAIIGEETSICFSLLVMNRTQRTIKYAFLPHGIRFSTRHLRRYLFPKTYGVSLSRSFFHRAKKIETGYPGPMDFMWLETERASVAFWGEQPIADRPPFSKDEPVLIPARLSVRGLRAVQGNVGEMSHGHNVWIEPGHSFTTPKFRFELSDSLDAALRRYATVNGITRTLKDKMKSDWQEFSRSLIVHCEVESADSALELARALPPNSTVHYASYLPNGFDRYYPVHLPPSQAFGSEEDFTHAMGTTASEGRRTLLYTNYTWWCADTPMLNDHGLTGLQLREDGAPILEYYYEQTGFTASMWSPVHHRFMLDEIKKLAEMGCDMVLIDQLSARPFKPPFLTEDAFWDFNEACPYPFAAPQGLADAAKAVSEIVPLSTEVWDNGPVDYLGNWVSQYCGYHVEGIRVEPGLPGAEGREPARRQEQRVVELPGWGPTLFTHGQIRSDRKPISSKVLRESDSSAPRIAQDISFYPLIHHILHDKAAFTWHDLAPDRSASDLRMVTITLLLGFQMIYHAGSRGEPAPDVWRRFASRPGKDPIWPDEETSIWITTLALLGEKFVLVGAPLGSYREVSEGRHVVGYGGIRVLANLTDQPWDVGCTVPIAPDGFLLEQLDQAPDATSRALACGSMVDDSGIIRWLWDER